MRKIEFKKSHDGSHTLFLPDMNETYHSIHGAVNESKHVFLKMGFEAITAPQLTILEIGFGTGLNAFLTALEAEKTHRKIKYITLEPFPIPEEIYTQLNYPDIIDPEKKSLFLELHEAEWGAEIKLSDTFTFHKSQQKLEDSDFNELADLVYFDAFAPNKQPELWEVTILEKCYDALKSGGILVTYCSQGQFKRNLKAAGFMVEALQGPPGKREMTRGIKPLPPVY